MYSLSLFPKITTPTRITFDLIDNIYTKDIENKTVSVNLMKDISDHVSVFIIDDCIYRNKKTDKQIECRRMRSEESMDSFKSELWAQNWEAKYQEKNVGNAYKTLFKCIYVII